MSLRFKFVFLIAVYLLVVLGAFGYYIVTEIEKTLDSQVRARGENIINGLKSVGKQYLESRETFKGNPLGYIRDETEVVDALLLNPINRILASTDPEEFPLTGVPTESMTKKIDYIEYTWKKKRVYIISRPITDSSGNKIGSAMICLSREKIYAYIEHTKQVFIFIIGAAIVLSIIMTLIFVTFIVRPIKKLVAGAEQVGKGDLNTRVNINSSDEIGLLARVFNMMAGNLKKAQEAKIAQELTKQELSFAGKIQAALLPESRPVIKGLDIDSFYSSAQEVGGDYYDFINVDDSHLGIAIGDVSGKGLPGSMMMTMVRSTLRAEARKVLDPAKVLSNVNRLIFPDIKKGMFVSMFYGIIDINTLSFVYTNAGHNPLIHYVRESDRIFLINPEGLAIGLDGGAIFDSAIMNSTIKLAKGDIVIQYTDGVTEAMNAKHEEFGEDRFKESIKKYCKLDATVLVEGLKKDIFAFTGNTPQHDDITLIVVKAK